jgi:murein DD-endopeptidase MepM/ murein hydrolase activator NlpD
MILCAVEKEKNIMIEGSILTIFNRLFQQTKQQDKSEDQLFFLAPSTGFIIKQFEPSKGHLGIDFGVRDGSPVYSSSGGLVIFSDFTAEDGNMIIIKHEKEFISVYKHCSVLIKKERDKVIPGELIALSGNTGISTTGPHLHFEIWKEGKAIDPQKLIINK